jgi:glycosyltransferase involved in cell wall biosynthesis
MRKSGRARVKQIVLPCFFKHISAFFSPGEANRDYLLAYQVPSASIHWCPFAIELERFSAAALNTTEAPIDFVWVGKMIDLKRPMDFLQALAQLAQRGHRPLSALMVGSGPLLDAVRRTTADLPASVALTCSGFVNQSALPAELRLCRVLVFTSERDQYGLAVTEAAACGLAVIAADINGCVGATASARPGLNALTYPAGDVQALAECMATLLRDPQRLQAMQQASLAVAAEHGIDRAAAIIESTLMGEVPHDA